MRNLSICFIMNKKVIVCRKSAIYSNFQLLIYLRYCVNFCFTVFVTIFLRNFFFGLFFFSIYTLKLHKTKTGHLWFWTINFFCCFLIIFWQFLTTTISIVIYLNGTSDKQTPIAPVFWFFYYEMLYKITTNLIFF